MGPGFKNLIGICLQNMQTRLTQKDESRQFERPDFLDRFLEAKAANPDTVDDARIISWLMINLLAGADSTATVLCSVLYFCLKDPRIWDKLQGEISAAGLSARSPTAYKDVRSLPYLGGIIRESLRFLPGGVTVGMNPYILCRKREVYGKDSDSFRPERWLRDEGAGETEEQFQTRLSVMNAADITFGGGSRICIGKNLALLELYKIVATLISRYEMELVDPDKEWKVQGLWFPRQRGIEVKMRQRVSP